MNGGTHTTLLAPSSRDDLNLERVHALTQVAAFARLFTNTTTANPLNDLAPIQRWIWRDLVAALDALDELTA